MLSLAMALLLTQSPPSVAVVVTRKAAVPSARAAKLLERLQRELTSAGIEPLPAKELTARFTRLGLKDATFCAGKRGCLVELGTQLPTDYVVGVSLTFLKPDLSLVVEAVRSSDGTLVAETSAVLAAGNDEVSFADFAKTLESVMHPVVAVVSKPPDAPVITEPPPLVPAAEPTPVVVTRPSAAPALVTAGVGVAALGAGVGLTIAAFSTASTFAPDANGNVALTYAEAQAARNTANGELAGGIACGVGAVAMGIMTWLLWPSDKGAIP